MYVAFYLFFFIGKYLIIIWCKGTNNLLFIQIKIYFFCIISYFCMFFEVSYNNVHMANGRCCAWSLS